MEQPLRVTFRGLEPTEAIEASIREHAARLDRYYDGITGCHVSVEVPHRHHKKGHLYEVRIDLSVKGGELVVRRDPAQHQAHEDLYVAIRDAFDAARRRLQDHARRRRADIKTSVGPARARVVKILPEEGYGFLETPDRREIYFNRNSVLGDAFDRLAIGSMVHFAEEQGEKGPRATSVAVQD